MHLCVLSYIVNTIKPYDGYFIFQTWILLVLPLPLLMIQVTTVAGKPAPMMRRLRASLASPPSLNLLGTLFIIYYFVLVEKFREILFFTGDGMKHVVYSGCFLFIMNEGTLGK